MISCNITGKYSLNLQFALLIVMQFKNSNNYLIHVYIYTNKPQN